MKFNVQKLPCLLFLQSVCLYVISLCFLQIAYFVFRGILCTIEKDYAETELKSLQICEYTSNYLCVCHTKEYLKIFPCRDKNVIVPNLKSKYLYYGHGIRYRVHLFVPVAGDKQ